MLFTKFLYQYGASLELEQSVIFATTIEERATPSHYWATTDRPWFLFELARLADTARPDAQLDWTVQHAALCILLEWMQPQGKEVNAMLNVYRMSLQGECELTTALCLSFQRLVCSFGTPNTPGATLEPFEIYAAQATCCLLSGDYQQLTRLVAEAYKWKGVQTWSSWLGMATIIRTHVDGQRIAKIIEQL